MQRIYYLGPEGTFTHQAAMVFQSIYGLSSYELAPLPSVERVIHEIGSADEGDGLIGCVPIENSIHGSVPPSWDAIGKTLTEEQQRVTEGSLSARLGKACNQIVAACRLPIRQNLLTAAPIQLTAIREVYSHPQALAQCKQWLGRHLPNVSLYSIESTALAAERVKEQNRHDIAAIAALAAASHYGLHVQSENIQDMEHNMTRFALFGKPRLLQGTSSSRTNDESLILSLLLSGVSNCPGGLYQALEPFTYSELNLRRIESRPVGTDLGTYVFYLDVEWPSQMSAVHWDNVYADFAQVGIQVTLLGLYPEHTVPPAG